MRLELWADVDGFFGRAEGFLLADEARHHLTFGIALAFRERIRAQVALGPPFLAVIEAQGAVVATVVRSGFNLIVSPADGIDLAGSAVLDELAEIVSAEHPDLPGVLAPRSVAREFAAAWTRRTGMSSRLAMRERSHELRVVRPLVLPSGRLRLATTMDRALIVPWLAGMHAEIGLPEPFDPEAVADRRLAPPDAPGDPYRSLYLWVDDDDEPRSMAGAQATTATGVRIGAVYTPPEHRRAGYATAVVAGLSQAMLDRGRRACYLFTDLANPTSNHIYAEIGFEPVCDLDEIRFG